MICCLFRDGWRSWLLIGGWQLRPLEVIGVSGRGGKVEAVVPVGNVCCKVCGGMASGVCSKRKAYLWRGDVMATANFYRLPEYWDISALRTWMAFAIADRGMARSSHCMGQI